MPLPRHLLPLLALALAGCATGEGLSVSLPGSGWEQRMFDPLALAAVRTDSSAPAGSGAAVFERQQSIEIQPVEILAAGDPASLADRHFDRLEETTEARWQDVIRGTRTIGDREFATLQYRTAAQTAASVADVTVLAYFPADHAEQGRFFVFVWSDVHPEGEPAGPLDDLDWIVESFRVIR